MRGSPLFFGTVRARSRFEYEILSQSPGRPVGKPSREGSDPSWFCSARPVPESVLTTCSRSQATRRPVCPHKSLAATRAVRTEAAMPGGNGCLTARGLRNVAIASAPSVIVILTRFLPIDGLWRAATAAWHATRRRAAARASAGQRGRGGPGPLGRRESGTPRREARRPPPRARPGDLRPRSGAGVAARAEA